jgi:molybdopterin converting factor small subunit
MDISIKLNHAFQPYAGNREIVKVSGSSVKECLDNLIDFFPNFKELLFNTDNALSALVLLDGETIVTKDLNRPVTEQSELVLLPMIQGG